MEDTQQARLKQILQTHQAEFCPACNHEIGLGDIAWNEASTEAGTPVSTIEIQCVICQTEIKWLHSWTGIDDIDDLLDIIEDNWR